MKTTFNFFKLSTLALALTFAATSCSLFEKKDDPKPAKSEVEYNGSNYNLDQGLIVDLGAANLYGNDDTHYDYDFYVSDGDIEDNGDEVEEIQGSFGIFTECYSLGDSEFKTGTFTFVDASNDGSLSDSQRQTKYKNKSVFASSVYIDANGNGILSDEVPIRANGGTVKVSGSSPNFTIEYDLTLANGKTLKGRRTGSFNKIRG